MDRVIREVGKIHNLRLKRWNGTRLKLEEEVENRNHGIVKINKKSGKKAF